LEDTTWTALDMLAAKRGIRWQDWASEVLATQPDAPNRTALIRAALADELMAERIVHLTEAGSVEADTHHEIIGNGYWRINDEQL
ncbi:hypothetical protein SMA60_28700, partial [Escherichia coli]